MSTSHASLILVSLIPLCASTAKLTVTFVLIGLFAFSLYGWGRVFRFAFHMERGTWPATAAVGMAFVVFLGGVLNLARLAHPAAFAIIFGIGAAIAGIGAAIAGGVGAGIGPGIGALLSVRGLREISVERRSHHAIVFLLAALVMGFVVWTQLPPKAYNIHDDYQKYLAHAVRMIETGTVYGSPLSAVGSETLGGQAFMQGFIVAFFPISYINGFDAVFAMFLCLMLASEFTGWHPRLLLMTMIAMLSVVVINPQYVNISTLYSGSALVMALATMISDPREIQEHGSIAKPVVIGLLCAALIALKTTFALFVIVLLLFLAVVLGVRWSVRTLLYFAAFLSPWMLLHASRYLAALRGFRGTVFGNGFGANAHLNFFSFDRLDYGSSIASYTMLMAAIGISALVAWWAAGKQDRLEASPARLMAVVCGAGIATYFILLVGGTPEFGSALAVRYYVPIAIGLAPAAFGLAARYVLESRELRLPNLAATLPIVVAVLPLLVFLPSLRDRVLQAKTSGSVLAFSWLADDRTYLEYNQQMLQGSAREKVAAMLGMVPAGETVIAWIDMPFYLDYARNRIIDAEPAGLSTRWAIVPPARYVIWEYKGYATRSEADLVAQTRADGSVDAMDRLHATRTLEFLQRVRAWTAQGQLLYDDGERKVVRLADSPDLSSAPHEVIAVHPRNVRPKVEPIGE
jgi:hypothetical protein